jgi:hypothetical protein
MADDNILPVEIAEASPLDAEDALISGWLGRLLNQIDDNLPAETAATLLKGCALAHYQHLNMDQTLTPYQGNLPAFLRFLNETWHWQVTYDQDTHTIIADENKNFCVCPLVQRRLVNSSILCFCSEGFAGRMFAAVLNRPVKATVTQSVLRGDASCVYTIQMEKK